MKPVAVFRFSDTEGPGHFATFLDANRLPWTLVKLDEGDPVPASSEAFSGLAFMGGPMSANDELAWTQPVLALMRDAVARDVPVIGHCLGGQMLARALGGEVRRNPVKEIGWNRVKVEDSPLARQWFGPLTEFDTFQWHGDTFAIPPGAQRILTGPHCPNQAYVAGDRFTAADVYVGSHISWGTQFGTLPKRDSFDAYLGRIMSRPAAQRAQGIDGKLREAAQG